MGHVETKAAVKERLQAEGRWKPALDFRESLKEQGVPPAEAHRRMVETFPPLPAGQAPTLPVAAVGGDSAPVERPRRRRRRKGGESNDLRRDVEWVYSHLTEPDDRGAPSEGARSLWTWAKTDPGAFFRAFVAKLMPTSPRANGKSNEAEEPVDLGRQLLDDIMKRYSHPEAEHTSENGHAPA
jgi:hypothetical protein